MKMGLMVFLVAMILIFLSLISGLECTLPCLGAECEDSCNGDSDCVSGQYCGYDLLCYDKLITCRNDADCVWPNQTSKCYVSTCEQGYGCTQPVPKVCDDNNICTNNWCNPATGDCIFTAKCTDSNRCTNDLCNEITGICSHPDLDCDDNWGLTVDSCDTTTGCIYTTKQFDSTSDADNIMWGTETYPEIWNASEIPWDIMISIEAMNSSMKTKLVKVRLYADECMDPDFAPNRAIHLDCKVPSYASFEPDAEPYKFDEMLRVFKKNNWTMIPMISYSGDMILNWDAYKRDYPIFAEWIVNYTMQNGVDIKYVELENCPNGGSMESTFNFSDLLYASNEAYRRIKVMYPNLPVGTPGFEYWMDEQDSNSVAQIEYFLNKSNGANFDFWAFHGYPIEERTGQGLYFVAPTRNGTYNPYVGIPGILLIRRRMDANGWTNRYMIDTEHISIAPRGNDLTSIYNISEADDELAAAYMVQELVLKRTARVNGKTVLKGIAPLKFALRGQGGEKEYGSLQTDGSITKHLKASSYLLYLLDSYVYTGHVSGEYNMDDHVWVERFGTTGKELYIFFKPFDYVQNRNLEFDNSVVEFNLTILAVPKSATLISVYGDAATNITPSRTIKLQAENMPRYLEVVYS